jgi:hypothetical protein
VIRIFSFVMLFVVTTNLPHQGQFVQAQFGGDSFQGAHPPAIAEKASPCGSLSVVPNSAVTKGSFTVWTEPENPNPGQQYTIMVQIKVLNNLDKYPVCDISGSVTGTDGYKDYFGGPTEKSVLPVKNLNVRLPVLLVPGGSQMVKDVIHIKSKLLKEEQQLEITF